MSDYPAGLIDGFTRGTHLLRAGLCDEAMVEFRAVYAQARQVSDEDLMAACLCEMGWCNYKLGQTEQALECAMGARGLRQRQGDTVELARAMAVEAIVFLDLGFSDEAFDLSVEAVDVAQAGSDAAVLAFALNAKGLVLALCRETELGMALIERAVSIAAEQANIAAEAYYLLNLGFCHTKLAEEAETFGEPGRAIGEREAAIDLSERAIDRAESSGDHWTLRVALCNTAEMLALQGRHDLASACLERHANLPGDPGTSLRIHYLYTLGDLKLRSGYPAQASTILAEALALADTRQQLDHQVNSARKLAEVLETMGDAKAALAMFKRFHALYVTQSGETARRRARIEAIRSETEQWRSRAATLADQALNDALTGIANRRSFDQILNRLAGTPLALAVLDLDHFKSVNDLFSHIVGDAVLQRVAQAIVAQIGPHGHAARLGGEEFGLIFPDASEATAAAFCEGVRIAIANTDWSDMAPGLQVTASIGLAAGDGTTPSGELMQSADNRLYIAKNNGRDRLVIADAPGLDKQKVAGMTRDAFRQFEEQLARYDDPAQTGAALHALAATIIPARLFTLTAINGPAGHVRRVYSSHPDVYPLLGTKPLVIDDWFRAMQTERRITAINTASGMEGQFPDLALIRSLGCNSSLSIPVMAGNDLLGTINALDAEGSYPDAMLDRAADLIIPATAVFLILRAHFAL